MFIEAQNPGILLPNTAEVKIIPLFYAKYLNTSIGYA